jgi:hypothetical protein
MFEAQLLYLFVLTHLVEMWRAAFGRPFERPATRSELRASRKVPPEWQRLHSSLKAQRKFAVIVRNCCFKFFCFDFLF